MSILARSHGVMVLVAAAALCAAIAAAAGQVAPSASGPTNKQHDQTAMTGEQIFAANCIRCHTPPMTLSPRVTGTIIDHMRMRARLSRKEQQLLLKYLAP